MKKELLFTLTRKKISAVLAVIIIIDIILYFILDATLGNSRLLNGVFIFSIIIPAILARILLSYVDYQKEQLRLRNKKDKIIDSTVNTMPNMDDLFDL